MEAKDKNSSRKFYRYSINAKLNGRKKKKGQIQKRIQEVEQKQKNVHNGQKRMILYENAEK